MILSLSSPVFPAMVMMLKSSVSSMVSGELNGKYGGKLVILGKSVSSTTQGYQLPLPFCRPSSDDLACPEHWLFL